MNISPQSRIWWEISKSRFSTASSMNESHVFILLCRVVESIFKHSKGILLLSQ
jgi:hypothetical protein